MSNTGQTYDSYVSEINGVRPLVSLKHIVEYERGGDGTPTNPYVIKYN